MSFTRCTLVGHDWKRKRYPDAPAQDEGAVYAECRRCGKQREIEPHGVGAFQYTVGGKF